MKNVSKTKNEIVDTYNKRVKLEKDFFHMEGKAMKCTMCDKEATGKSKYCSEHKKEARQRWLQMIDEKAQEKRDRDRDYNEIFREAYNAGLKAGQDHAPQPMVIVEQLPNTGKQYFCPEGMCGFAWVIILDRKFGNWLKKNKIGDRDYKRGVNIWISDHNQSYEKKQAHARAMVDVFTKHGIDCYAGSRLD